MLLLANFADGNQGLLACRCRSLEPPKSLIEVKALLFSLSSRSKGIFCSVGTNFRSLLKAYLHARDDIEGAQSPSYLTKSAKGSFSTVHNSVQEGDIFKPLQLQVR